MATERRFVLMNASCAKNAMYKKNLQ